MANGESKGPFAEVRVVDLATGPTGALASQLIASLGASVTWVQPPYSDPYLETSPSYRTWRSECPSVPYSEDALAGLLAEADVCLTGGDDHPAATRHVDPRNLLDRYPGLVVLSLTGTVPGSGAGDLPANDLLAQARSGLSTEHFSDRPIAFGVSLPVYGAVLHGVIGVAAALCQRESTGRGEIVSTSLVQGAAAFMAGTWIADENSTTPITGRLPKDIRWGMLQCADGRWITFAQGLPGSTARMHETVGLEPPPGSVGQRWSPKTDDPKLFFGVTDELRDAFLTWQSADLHRALVDVGVTAEIVQYPGECWTDEQVEANRLLATTDDGTTYVAAPIDFATEAPV